MTSGAYPAKLRVLDYVANDGGGLRFVAQLVKALSARGDFDVEIASHGEALDNYRRAFAAQSDIRVLDLKPERFFLSRGFVGFRGATRLNSMMHLDRFYFEVPLAAWAGCDVLWLPWIHRHRIPENAPTSFASLHDLILLQFRGLVRERWRTDEYETVRRWLDSPARIAVSSVATANEVNAVFGCTPGRVRVIPVSGAHDEPAPSIRIPRCWPFAKMPYIVCPATTSPHKNHEVLFSGAAAAAKKHPIVLTGSGTDFWSSRNSRGTELRASAQHAGLVWGQSLIGLGLVPDATYYAVLDGAWGLVMPTLAEGGGSFPVLEAMQRGIPVVASDIPVMREMVERFGGEVLWFDPADAASLAARLMELDGNYESLRCAAIKQGGQLRSRTWAHVAAEYADFLRS